MSARATGVALAALLLAACTAAPRLPDVAQDWPIRRASLQALDAFQFNGRVGVVAASGGFSAQLRWQQVVNQSVVELNGPFGVGATRIESDGQRLRVVQGEGKAVEIDDGDATVAALLGAPVPLTSLRYWVLGVPDPREPAVETPGVDGRLASLSQAGWQVTYERYAAVDGDWLPARILVTRDGARLRLLIERWQAG